MISAYQACEQQIRENNKVKSLTVTAQQTSMLILEDWNEQPRSAFIKDLEKIIQAIQDKGHGVLIVGNFNESLYKPNSGMMKIL